MTKLEIVGRRRKETYSDLLRKSKIKFSSEKVGKTKWLFKIKK